jgi:hypothetical protein
MVASQVRSKMYRLASSWVCLVSFAVFKIFVAPMESAKSTKLFSDFVAPTKFEIFYRISFLQCASSSSLCGLQGPARSLPLMFRHEYCQDGPAEYIAGTGDPSPSFAAVPPPPYPFIFQLSPLRFC